MKKLKDYTGSADMGIAPLIAPTGSKRKRYPVDKTNMKRPQRTNKRKRVHRSKSDMRFKIKFYSESRKDLMKVYERVKKDSDLRSVLSDVEVNNHGNFYFYLISPKRNDMTLLEEKKIRSFFADQENVKCILFSLRELRRDSSENFTLDERYLLKRG